MSTQLAHEDYTVAWIAVLPIEAEAALKVLDQRHDGWFDSAPGDDYLYIGGELNGHNVVIATSPAGQVYGIGSAAALASQIKTRFVNIWFALLVGVAAGLPNLFPSEDERYRDIRLGDVLVSESDQLSTGVVHYDLGRNTEDGFETVGRSNEPPSILRSAYVHMKLLLERPYKQGNLLATYLERLQDADKSQKFLRPDPSTDQLFETPLQDDQPREIYREPRQNDENAVVWYGNIGSGNSLMRNAKRRDELRDRYNLIGLEMEAAGVTNTLPTGVIRGVCDYGDRHKTKQWQPYAAAVAAVYAKGILGLIRAKNSHGKRKLREYQGDEYAAQELKLNGVEQEFIASLAFPQMNDRRLKVRKPHEGTCRWILELPRYREWDSRPCGLLWIKGKPGAGKSTLMTFLHSLIGEKEILDDIIYLEFFFNARGDPLQYTFIGMLRSLLNQIVRQDPRSRDLLTELYRKKQAAFGGGSRKWDWLQEELEPLLEQVILESAIRRRIFIFIDALDEAGEDAAWAIAEYFNSINTQLISNSAAAKIYISCRHYPITSDIGGTEICVEDHNYDDIQAYVKARVYRTSSRFSTFRDTQKWHQLTTSIVEQARGVFQWVSLILPLVERSIRNGCSPAQTHSRLSEIPHGISNTYKHILSNVIDRSSIQQSFLLFQWACLAERPLGVSELRYALAVNDVSPPLAGSVGVTCCDTANFVDSDQAMIIQLNALSGGLLEHTHNVVQVVHQTVKEFLVNDGLALLESMASEMDRSLKEKIQNTRYSDFAGILQRCHARLYWSCLRYLVTEQLTLPTKQEFIGALRGLSKYSEIIVSGPHLTSYAAKYIFVHAVKGQYYHVATVREQAKLMDQLFRTLKNLRRDAPWIDDWSTECNQMITLHVAATFGLEDLMQYLLTTEVDVNARIKETMSTALHCATCYNQPSTARQLLASKAEVDAIDGKGNTSLMLSTMMVHKQIMELLLEYQADVDIQDNNGETALMLASVYESTELVQLLLDYQANVNVQNVNGNTALTLAAGGSGKTEMVRLLLEHQADVNVQDKYGTTPLLLAAGSGQTEVVQLLLEHRANVNVQNIFGNTALALAAGGSGKIEMVRLLLDHQPDVNVQDSNGRTALMAAAGSGQTEVVQLLLEYQADANVQDSNGRTALMSAAGSGQTGLARLLLDHQADANVQDNNRRTALMLAADLGQTKVVQLLLEHQANVNIVDRYGTTASMSAVVCGQTGALRLLLEYQANVNAQNNNGDTALTLAAGGSNKTEMVQLLLEHQADVNVQDNYGTTPLILAAGLGQIKFAQLLLEHRANVNVRDKNGRTALSTASMYGRAKVVRLLLEHQANVNVQDNNGRTALRVASIYGRAEVVRVLLEYQADVSVQDGDGRTALMSAALSGQTEMIRLLLEHHADMNVKDNHGRTALWWASKRGHEHIAEIFSVRQYQAGSPGVNWKDSAEVDFT